MIHDTETQRHRGTQKGSSKPVMSWWTEAPWCLCSYKAEQYSSFYIWQHRLTTVLLITLPLSFVTSVASCDLSPPTHYTAIDHPQTLSDPWQKWKPWQKCITLWPEACMIKNVQEKCLSFYHLSTKMQLKKSSSLGSPLHFISSNNSPHSPLHHLIRTINHRNTI